MLFEQNSFKSCLQTITSPVNNVNLFTNDNRDLFTMFTAVNNVYNEIPFFFLSFFFLFTKQNKTKQNKTTEINYFSVITC